MQALCLSNDLIKEYIDFKYGKSFDTRLVTKLLKFIQPALVCTSQHSLFQDVSAAGQFVADPIINLTSFKAENRQLTASQLVDKTILKVQLVTKKNNNADFTQLDINALSDNFERLNMLLTGVHETNTHKQEALNHIKALISDAEFVKITDNYLHEKNSWEQSKSVLDEILPRKNILVKIITDNFDKHTSLKKIYSGWQVKAEQINQNVHDRYIETDKIKIMLSSGIFHLSKNSNTDLTYTVRIKNDKV